MVDWWLDRRWLFPVVRLPLFRRNATAWGQDLALLPSFYCRDNEYRVRPFVKSAYQKILFSQPSSVVECFTRDRGAVGSSLIGVTALCPWAWHINPSLVLVQPRKTCPYITERLLIGHKDSNKISQPKHMLWVLKRTVSMRRFFWAPKTYAKSDW